MTLLFSVEVCLRLYRYTIYFLLTKTVLVFWCRETKRMSDPDLDNLANPHEVNILLFWFDLTELVAVAR